MPRLLQRIPTPVMLAVIITIAIQRYLGIPNERDTTLFCVMKIFGYQVVVAYEDQY